MALIGEEFASNTALDQVLCICSGRRPIKPCTVGLANKGPSCGMVTAGSGMNFNQELPPFFLGYTSLKDSGGAFLIELSIMNLVGLRVPDNAAGLILVLRKLLPIKVGQEGFAPWGNDCHDEMHRRCYVDVSEIWGYVRIQTKVAALPLPHHRWLEKPFQKDVGWDGVTLSANAGKDIESATTPGWFW